MFSQTLVTGFSLSQYGSESSRQSDLVFQLLMAAIGSFVGALAAFGLEWLREYRRDIQRDCRIGQVALARLLDRFNWLKSMNIQSLDEFRTRDERWYHLPPLSVPPLPIDVDVSSLAFLINQQNPNLVNLLQIDQARFHHMAATLKRRNDNHLACQRALADLSRRGIPLVVPPTAETRRQVGEDLVADLIASTDDLYTLADKSLTDAQHDFKILRAALKSSYPRQAFLEVQWAKTEAASKGPPTTSMPTDQPSQGQ